MRRAGLLLLASLSAAGCGRMSVGLWADSSRGQSVAAVSSIDLPAEPTALRKNPKAAKPVEDPADDWDVPDHAVPAVSSTRPIPKADAKPKLESPKAEPPKPEPVKSETPNSKSIEVESWTPKLEPGAKPPEFAHDKEYKWIQGRVTRVKISGARVWEIRFAPYDQEDQYGGSFVLDGALPKDLKEGELIRVNGVPSSASPHERNPGYRCEQITFMDRTTRPAK
jgi:hypothetical protein